MENSILTAMNNNVCAHKPLSTLVLLTFGMYNFVLKSHIFYIVYKLSFHCILSTLENKAIHDNKCMYSTVGAHCKPI